MFWKLRATAVFLLKLRIKRISPVRVRYVVSFIILYFLITNIPQRDVCSSLVLSILRQVLEDKDESVRESGVKNLAVVLPRIHTGEKCRTVSREDHVHSNFRQGLALWFYVSIVNILYWPQKRTSRYRSFLLLYKTFDWWLMNIWFAVYDVWRGSGNRRR